MGDTEYLEYILRAGPATTNEILGRSFRDRGCGLTVHSRAADLRRRLEPLGETVSCTTTAGRNRHGKVDYRYALVPHG